MKKRLLRVETKSKSYPIYFGNNLLNKVGILLKKNLPSVKKVFIIVDNKVPKVYLTKLTKSLKNFNTKIYSLSTNEKIKNFNVANRIIEELLRNNFNRSDCVIAFGGGVIGDLSGFVSSLTKRGLKFINIPTTLLSQVDASIGGKTGVNSKNGKNLIGTFYQPDFVLSDISVLRSLPQREVISGYGEILKHSLILNKKFFFWLLKNGKRILDKRNSKELENAIINSSKIKIKVVKKDEREKNLRMILNFGHSFAHGFESVKNFSKKLNHGEAVLLGMMVASEFANKKKILPLKDLMLIKKHYQNLNLPMDLKKIFKKKDIKKIVYFMKKDKKNVDSKINLILISKIGNVIKPTNTKFSSKIIEEFLISFYA